MAVMLRDSRVRIERLEEDLAASERSLSKYRKVVHAGLEPDFAPSSRVMAAKMSVRLLPWWHKRLTYRYTAGDAVVCLVDILDRWADDLESVLRLQAKASSAPDFLRRDGMRRILLSASQLAVIARGVGHESITYRVLDAPGMGEAPMRIIDCLATTLGREASGGDADVLVGRWDSWLRVAYSAPAERQKAFEKYVQGWRREMEKVHAIYPVDDSFTGAWCFEAVTLVTLFGLDDSAVRDVPEYPTEFADFARERGTPSSANVLVPPDPAPVVGLDAFEPAERRPPLSAGGAPAELLIRVITPFGQEPVVSASLDGALNESIDAWRTVNVVDWRGVPASELGSFTRDACKALGLPAPAGEPDSESDAAVEVMTAVDAWLAPVGVRLLVIDEDSDQYLVVPVLAEELDALAGLRSGDVSARHVHDLA